MPFRLHRSLLFHLGLPGLLFLLWSWIDSMGTASSWNWIYGPAVKIPGAVSELPKFDYRQEYHWRLDGLPRTGSPCWSAGVKHGTLWITHWYSPVNHGKGSFFERAPAPRAETAFPPFHHEKASLLYGSSAVWIPHWLLLITYLIPWTALLLWRRKKHNTHLHLTDTLPPSGDLPFLKTEN